MLKRIFSLGLIGATLALTALTPMGALAVNNGSILQVTSATNAFAPSAGQRAAIDYRVNGPDSASEVMIRIYRATANNLRLCNDLAQNYVKTIEGPVNRAVGNYRTLWTGDDRNGSTVAPGLYCYQVRWQNPPTGAVNLIEGLITVNPADRPNVPAGYVPPADNGNVGNVNPPAAGNAGSPPAPYQPIVTANANPSIINPSAASGNTSYITYSINTDLSYGYSLKIYDRAGNIVRDLYSTNQYIRAGARATIGWNGRRNNGTIVENGDYIYKFRSNGADLASGGIRVEGGNPQPQPSADIVYYVNPSRIDPTAVPAMSATIYYTVNRAILTGLTIRVYDASNNPVRLLYSTNAVINAGSYSVSWNGRYNDGSLVPAGSYTYVLTSAGGQRIGQGAIYVEYAAPPPPVNPPPPPPAEQFVIGAPYANPAIFTPANGETTSIFYTLGKYVRNFRLSVRDLEGRLVTYLVSTSDRPAGSYSVTWNGTISTGYITAAGQYMLTLEADNEISVTAGPVSVLAPAVAVPPPPPPPPAIVAPVITDFGPNPTNFDPYSSDASLKTTSLRYQLTQDARVDVTILKNNVTIRRLVVSSYASNNRSANTTQSEIWDGRNDSGQIAPYDTYTYYIEARNSSGQQAVTRTGQITMSDMHYYSQQGQVDVSDIYANPSTFNSDLQSTYLYFTLNREAYVTVRVFRAYDAMPIKDVKLNELYRAGSGQTALWDGTDQSGYRVADGTYNFRVEAHYPGYGSDYATSTVTVSRATVSSSNILQITDSGPNPNPFNPNAGQIMRIDFSTNMAPSTVGVKIYRQSTNTFIRQLSVYAMASNLYRAEWNGRDDGNQVVVTNDTYTYRIEVNAGSQIAQKSGTIYLSSTTYYTPGTNYCGSFKDVSTNNSLCTAIEFVKVRGIFAGYHDGTIGLDRVIQRVELLAVIQKAFQFPLDPYSPGIDGDLGYRDLDDQMHEWYMPYVKTFSRLKLMVGYPDGRMRPERTMSTAELYLVFLKAGLKSPLAVAHYSLKNTVMTQPFVDTPIKKDTLWYIKYAAFAKLNDLVTTEHFYPARGITRGQVIKLIYDTYRKGLITYNQPIIIY